MSTGGNSTSTRPVIDGDATLPFTRLLGTNTIPTDQEVVEIESEIESLSVQLNSIDSELEEAMGRVRTLSEKRSELLTDIQFRQVIISRVRQLPRDILETIFLHCLPADRNVAMNHREAPITLSRVCRLWRRIAFATPRLWATLHIPIPSLHYRYPVDELSMMETDADELHNQYSGMETKEVEAAKKRIEVAKEWLRRSGSCPLSLSLSLGHADNAVEEVIRTVMGGLLEFATRWRNLELELPFAVDACTLYGSLPPGGLPLLHSLYYIGSDMFLKEPSALMQSPNLLDAPSLRVAHIILIPNSLRLFLPWHQLTDLLIESCQLNPAQCMDILRKCSNLVTCTLDVGSRITGVSPNPDENFHYTQTISLPSLENFTFFECLHLPAALETPSLTSFRYQGPSSFEIRAVQLLKHAHNITSLSFDGLSSSVEWRTKILPSVPNLRHLSFCKVSRSSPASDPDPYFSEHFLTSSLLEALSPVGDSLESCLCPKLETFECKQYVDFSDEALRSFILARYAFRDRGIATLRRFVAYFDRPLDIDLREELAHILAQGLKMELRYPRPLKSDDRSFFSPWKGMRVSEGAYHDSPSPWP